MTKSTRVFFAATFLAFPALVLVGVLSQFHAELNDFWGTVYYAQNMRWSEKASLYNAFFPIGYALLVRLFPPSSLTLYAFVASSISAALAIAAISTIVAAREQYRGASGAFLVALTYPLMFRYANIPGPDIACVAFICFAVLLLWKDELRGQRDRDSMRSALLVGGLLGLASVWRNHGVVIAGAVILSYLLVAGVRPLRTRVGLITAFLAIYSCQVFVNVLSGHVAFETGAKANVYANLNPNGTFDYFNFPTSIEESVFEMLLANPLRSIGYYLDNVTALSTLAWPSLLCLVFAQSKAVRSYSLFALTAIILYALPVAIGGSPRAPLVLMPMFVPPLVFLVFDAVERTKILARDATPWRYISVRVFSVGAIVLLAFLQLSLWGKEDIKAIRQKHRTHQEFVEVQQILLKEGMKSPDEVFTDAFDLYFPDVPPYRPRLNGGWFRYSLYGYNDKYPPLPTQSAVEFITGCAAQGIKFLVLTPASKKLADFLFRRYNEEEIDGIGASTFIGKVGSFKIFTLR